MPIAVNIKSEDTLRYTDNRDLIVHVKTSGVAILDLSGVPEKAGDWTRADAVFLIGPTMADSHIKQYLKSLPMVVPSTVDVAANLDTSKSVGWGVDGFSSQYDPTSDRTQVTATIVVKSKYSEVLRIAYLVDTIGWWDENAISAF